jgi:hypothetical protein
VQRGKFLPLYTYDAIVLNIEDSQMLHIAQARDARSAWNGLNLSSHGGQFKKVVVQRRLCYVQVYEWKYAATYNKTGELGVANG